LHILEEQTQKNKNFGCSKINSKWPVNSRWLPKLILKDLKITKAVLNLRWPPKLGFRLKALC
jgi:hypothetical protein